MIPKFLHKRRLAHPWMVLLTFWLAVMAAVFRVTPLLLSNVLDSVPSSLVYVRMAFGLSGLLGWSAIAFLGWNLVAT